MLHIAVLIFLTLFLAIFVKKILVKALLQKQNNYENLKSQADKAAKENAKLKAEALCLEKQVDETIALYNLTRDVRRILDEKEIFNLFRERINAYIKVGDCQFLNKDTDLALYNDYTILPLTIEENVIGYLLANGIAQKDKDKFHILSHQFALGIKGAFLFKQIQGLTIIDTLTQIFNRRYFLERFKEEFQRSKKSKLCFSLLMVDIDHFKSYNDHYGHLVGDAIIRETVKAFKENIRQIDFMGRYGGEEIAIILVETDKVQAHSAAMRIRQAVESRLFSVYDEDLRATISIGISTFPEDAGEPSEIIDKADEALYQAKQSGRNRVCAYQRQNKNM